MAKAGRFHILLVRSGATAWEAEGRLEGSTDLPLSDVGSAEVQSMMSAFAGTELRVVLSGPDMSSVETAQSLARQVGCKTRSVEDLREVHMGLWEGVTRTELLDKHPKAAKSWEEDPSGVQIPEGEDLSEAQDRLVSALGKSLKKMRDVSPGVGLVVKPLAYALIRCWAQSVPISSLWSMRDGACGSEWLELERDRFAPALRV